MITKGDIRIFNDGVAIVTGAASGIGRALSDELARRGCKVIMADLQIELAEKAAADIQSKGGKANAVQINVADFTAVQELVSDTVNRTGRLDYMFNNAGISIIGDTHLYTIESWDLIIDVNLRGVVNGVQAAYPLMYEQGFGHIVNTASVGGLASLAGFTAYCATKHAVVGLSKCLRAEAEPAGLRVSVICPGIIRTSIIEGGKFGKLYGISAEEVRKMSEMARPMEPIAFAQKALDDVAKNKAIIILPRWYRLIWWFIRLTPTSVEIALAKYVYLYRKKLVST